MDHDDGPIDWEEDEIPRQLLHSHLLDRFAMRAFTSTTETTAPFPMRYWGKLHPQPWSLSDITSDFNLYIRHHPPSLNKYNKPITQVEMSRSLSSRPDIFSLAVSTSQEEGWSINMPTSSDRIGSLQAQHFIYDDIFWLTKPGAHATHNYILGILRNTQESLTISQITRMIREDIWTTRPALNRFYMPECIQFDQVFKVFNKIIRAWLHCTLLPDKQEAWKMTSEARGSITCTALTS